jgi:hypothetical protein
MPVYRSVRVVFQNSTDETMTVHGFGVLRGQWTDKLSPQQGYEVLAQSSQAWSSESVELVSGTSGFVRLGSVRGYTKLSWSLPWVGEFQFTPECPPGLRSEVNTDTRQPDAIVVSVTVLDDPANP